MSSGRAQLDPRRFHHVQQPLDSAAQLYQDTTDLHPQPPPTASLMDVSGFDDFPFTYQGLSDQTPHVALGSQQNVTHLTDAFPNHPTTTVIDGSRNLTSTSVHGPGFGPAPSDHRRPSMSGSDGGPPDRNSPMANSLDDSVADEFGLSSQGPADGTDLGGKAKEDKTDAAPAWSELKTKAGKERKRLPLACIACRRKKIRCSGEKPACKHCLRGRSPCVYKVNTRKAAPRTDYMAMLDKRLKRMEDRIIKVVPKTEQEATTASVTRAVVKPAIPGSLSGNKSAHKKRSAEEAFGLSAFAKTPSKSTIAGDERPNFLLVQEAEETKLFQEGADIIPSKETQEQLAEVFFDHIYGQAYHLLHKPSYMRKLKNDTLPPVLVLSVCAVAVRFSADTKFKSETPEFLRGEEWASKARDICTTRYEWPNITILTCLLLLGLHEFGTCQGGRSWALGGQAIRMAFALQLHKDLDYDPTRRNGKKAQLSFIDREIRRRIMWACFLMDRFNSSGTDRPMFIREETIKIPLPVKEKYFQLDMPAPTETLDGQILHPASPDDGQVAETGENMGVAAYMIRSIALWGRIITYLYQGGKERDPEPIWSDDSEFATLMSHAEALQSTLPASLKYTPDNIDVHRTESTASQFLFLHIAIQQNILFLNRAAMPASNTHAHQQAPQEFFSESSTRMFAAANRISEFLREAEGSGYVVSAPFAGYCTFCSTTVHILGIGSRNEAMKRTAGSNLATNLKFLQKMRKYWGMFFYMVENVRTQYRNTLDAARTGNTVNGNMADSPILQYGDWFNRYPHGLSDAEFMDPATHRKKEKGADGVLEAKPDLKSVGEFFSSSLSPPQSTGSKDSQRGGNAKRKAGSKKQVTTIPRQGLIDQIRTTNPGGRTPSDQNGIQPQQQRRFSGALGGQSSGPSNFNPLTVAPHSQNPAFNTMSPISPVAVTPFPHHANTSSFFPPDVLPMSLSQQNNGILQPLDRQLVFGGYSMDTGNMAGGQNMMDGVDWTSLAGSGQIDDNVHSRRASVKGGMSRQPQQQQQQHQSQVHDPATTMAGFSGQEASSQWFMPFNMDPPPEMNHDLGLAFSNVDVFGGTFSASGSGMTTPNPLGGLRHGP
ncbi:Fc.00g077010.m01.CDS01 [Cosmosporella sp. VM-42]